MKKIKRAFNEVCGIEFKILKPTENIKKDSYCGIGRTSCYIRADGNVVLCPVLSNDKFIQGNIKEKDGEKDVATIEFIIKIHTETPEEFEDKESTVYIDYVFIKSKNNDMIILKRIAYFNKFTETYEESILVSGVVSIETLLEVELEENAQISILSEIYHPEDRILETHSLCTSDIMDILIVDEDFAEQIIDELENAEDPDGDIAIQEWDEKPWAWFVNSKKLSKEVRERLELFFRYGEELEKLLTI